MLADITNQRNHPALITYDNKLPGVRALADEKPVTRPPVFGLWATKALNLR